MSFNGSVHFRARLLVWIHFELSELLNQLRLTSATTGEPEKVSIEPAQQQRPHQELGGFLVLLKSIAFERLRGCFSDQTRKEKRTFSGCRGECGEEACGCRPGWPGYSYSYSILLLLLGSLLAWILSPAAGAVHQDSFSRLLCATQTNSRQFEAELEMSSLNSTQLSSSLHILRWLM